MVTDVQWNPWTEITALARDSGRLGRIHQSIREAPWVHLKFRVPAEALDKATARLREMAVEVKAEVSDNAET